MGARNENSYYGAAKNPWNLAHSPGGSSGGSSSAIAANLAGVIRFGCFHTIAPFHMSQLIKTYCETYPDVDVEAAELSQDEVVAGTTTGDLDLALTYDMSLDHRMLSVQTAARLRPCNLPK